MTTIRQRNGHLPHRHHSRLSGHTQRQAFSFARMVMRLPFGEYTITVRREPGGFRYEPVGEKMIKKTQQSNEEFLFEIAITGEGGAFIWATDQADAREQTDRLFGDWAKKATISRAREVRAVEGKGSGK